MNSLTRFPSQEIGATKRVAMILNSDFSLDSQGGVETYVRELSYSMEEKGIDIQRIGILTSKRIILRNERFIAKRRVSNYLFLLLLFKFAFRVRKETGLIIHAQRPEQLVPFFTIKKKKIALISSVHGPARTGVIQGKGKLIGAIYSILETIGLKIADSIIFVDGRTYKEYIKLFPWVEKKSRVIPSGISNYFLKGRIPQQEAISAFDLCRNEKIICFIGRLEHEKNVHLIIRAFARIATERPELILIIAGDGSKMESLKELALNLKIADKIRFLGQISHERVRELLSASEALVLASKFEGSPLVVKESLAIGTKIVSTNVGDISELIKNENFGQIVSEISEDALAEGIMRVLDMTGSSQREYLDKNLNWNVIADKNIEIYNESLRAIGYH